MLDGIRLAVRKASLLPGKLALPVSGDIENPDLWYNRPIRHT
jgi:hypothetical protein